MEETNREYLQHQQAFKIEPIMVSFFVRRKVFFFREKRWCGKVWKRSLIWINDLNNNELSVFR